MILATKSNYTASVHCTVIIYPTHYCIAYTIAILMTHHSRAASPLSSQGAPLHAEREWGAHWPSSLCNLELPSLEDATSCFQRPFWVALYKGRVGGGGSRSSACACAVADYITGVNEHLDRLRPCRPAWQSGQAGPAGLICIYGSYSVTDYMQTIKYTLGRDLFKMLSIFWS